MAAGDKEMYKAFEDVTTRNVKAGLNFSGETRKMLGAIQLNVDSLQKEIQQLKYQNQELNKQIALMRADIYQLKTK